MKSLPKNQQLELLTNVSRFNSLVQSPSIKRCRLLTKFVACSNVLWVIGTPLVMHEWIGVPIGIMVAVACLAISSIFCMAIESTIFSRLGLYYAPGSGVTNDREKAEIVQKLKQHQLSIPSEKFTQLIDIILRGEANGLWWENLKVFNEMLDRQAIALVPVLEKELEGLMALQQNKASSLPPLCGIFSLDKAQSSNELPNVKFVI